MAWAGLTDRWCCLIWIWSCFVWFPVCGFFQLYCARFWCPPRSFSCWEFRVRWKSPGIRQQEDSKSWRRWNFCLWNSPVSQPRCRWHLVPHKQLDKRIDTREERKEYLNECQTYFAGFRGFLLAWSLGLDISPRSIVSGHAVRGVCFGYVIEISWPWRPERKQRRNLARSKRWIQWNRQIPLTYNSYPIF